MKKTAYGVVLFCLCLCLGACNRKAETSASSEVPTSSTLVTPTMNLEELVVGNFQSVAGIWSNDVGEKLVFNQEGLVTSEYSAEPAYLTYYGTAKMIVNRGAQDLREGFTLEFIPAGVTMEEQTDDNGNVLFTDDSDGSRDRLWVGSGDSGFTEQGSFYYR